MNRKQILKNLKYKNISKTTGLPVIIIKDFVRSYFDNNKAVPVEFLTYLSLKNSDKMLDTNLVVKEYYSEKKSDYLASVFQEMLNLKKKTKEETIKNG